MPTKKDYLHVAAILHEERAVITTYPNGGQARTTLRRIENALCAYFYNDNPRFDREKFLLASGARAEEVPDARP